MVMTEHELQVIKEVGGRVIHRGGEEVFDFGYRGPTVGYEDCDALQADENDIWLDTLADYDRQGESPFAESTRVDYGDLWADPRTVKDIGRAFLCALQRTGSCVGAGGGNVFMAAQCLERIWMGDPEKIFLPFWPYTYGRSRYHTGTRGRGEGSTEQGWWKAATQDGVMPATLEGLPPPRWEDGHEYGAGVEMAWSDGSRLDPRWAPQAKPFIFERAWRARGAADVRHAIRTLKVVGWAGSWGGLMRCPVKGNPGVLLNERASTWNHKESCLGHWLHPTLGDIYKIYNQWGLRTHGVDPLAKSGGGYWITEAEMEWQCRRGEVIIYKGFKGLRDDQAEDVRNYF